MGKEVEYYKDGKLEKTKEGECHPLKLASASVNIRKEWYDVIEDVFRSKKAREAERQEVHKLFLDDRIDAGWAMYKQGRIRGLVKTDVDINAKVQSEEGGEREYRVVLKKWLPDTPPRMVTEMFEYIEHLFYDCTCEDHTITGHYRSNSNLCCKHIAAVMWYLQNEGNMPKFFQRKVDATAKSRVREILSKVKGHSLSEVQGYPMKMFTPYLNVLILDEFKGMHNSVSLSMHREANPGYQTKQAQPEWITYTEPEDIKKIIDALQQGYDEMLASRCPKVDVEAIAADIEKYQEDIKPFHMKTVRAYIEQIDFGHDRERIKHLNMTIGKTPDYLCLANKRTFPVPFDIFDLKYKQIGRFPVLQPHDFSEGEWVEIDVEDPYPHPGYGEILEVRKTTEAKNG